MPTSRAGAGRRKNGPKAQKPHPGGTKKKPTETTRTTKASDKGKAERAQKGKDQPGRDGGSRLQVEQGSDCGQRAGEKGKAQSAREETEKRRPAEATARSPQKTNVKT